MHYEAKVYYYAVKIFYGRHQARISRFLLVFFLFEIWNCFEISRAIWNCLNSNKLRLVRNEMGKGVEVTSVEVIYHIWILWNLSNSFLNHCKYLMRLKKCSEVQIQINKKLNNKITIKTTWLKPLWFGLKNLLIKFQRWTDRWARSKSSLLVCLNCRQVPWKSV